MENEELKKDKKAAIQELAEFLDISEEDLQEMYDNESSIGGIYINTLVDMFTDSLLKAEERGFNEAVMLKELKQSLTTREPVKPESEK